MSMKTCLKPLSLLACLVSSVGISMAAPKAVSFDDLPKLVKEHNGNVQAAQASFAAQEKRTGHFARSFLPGVSAEVGSESHRAGTDPKAQREYWKIGASMNLFRGGRDQLEEQRRQESAKAAEAESHGEFAKELKEARQTYWKLVAASQLMAQREESLKRNEENLKAARRRSSTGQASSADTLQFELHQTTLKQDLKKLSLERDLMRNRLSVAIGWDEHESIEVPEQFPHPSEQSPLPEELQPEKNLEVIQLRAKERVESLAAARASRWWAPSLDLYANYGIPSLKDEQSLALRRDKEWTAGVRLAVNLGDGLESRSEAGAKALEATAQERRMRHRIREAIAEDHELRHDLMLLHELIHDADQDISKAEKFLKLTEQEYARGVKNGPDLLSAFQRYYEFMQRRTELYRDFHRSTAELLALLSKGL
jgi:outer membrane protein TolC